MINKTSIELAIERLYYEYNYVDAETRRVYDNYKYYVDDGWRIALISCLKERSRYKRALKEFGSLLREGGKSD